MVILTLLSAALNGVLIVLIYDCFRAHVLMQAECTKARQLLDRCDQELEVLTATLEAAHHDAPPQRIH